MKRIVFFSVFILSLICCFVLSSQAESNTKTKAVALTIDKAVSVNCAKDEYGIDYWLKFKPSEKGYYEFNALGYADETYLYLYNANGVELSFAEWDSFFESTYITYNFKDTGTYYLNVHSYNESEIAKTIKIKAKKHKHVLNEEIDEQATCYEDGYYYLNCNKCNYNKVVTIPYVKNCKLNTASYIYDGKAKKPTLIIKDSNGNALKNGVDYKVSGTKSAKAIGKYSLKIKFQGHYYGTKTLSWQITPAKVTGLKVNAKNESSISLSWKKVSQATAYTVYYKLYDEAYSKTVTTNSIKLTKLYSSAHYHIQVAAVKKVNNIKVVGPKSSLVKCPTAPKKPSLYLESYDKGKIQLHFNCSYEYDNVSGYKIYVATSKAGEYKCIKTLNTTETWNSIELSGYKSGKTYFVKVRAFYTWSGQTSYSGYSSVKSIKVY